MKYLKRLPLYIRQVLFMILLLTCLVLGIILTFGEITETVNTNYIITFVLVKAVGLGFLIVSYVFIKAMMPNTLLSKYE